MIERTLLRLIRESDPRCDWSNLWLCFNEDGNGRFITFEAYDLAGDRCFFSREIPQHLSGPVALWRWFGSLVETVPRNLAPTA